MNMRSIAVIALSVGILAGCGHLKTASNAKPELHIYTWTDYIAPNVVEKFEQKFNCSVVIDTFDSNESMYAKVKAGATGYDIITPSSYLIDLMAKEGMIDMLDHSKLPNVRKNFDRSFAAQIIDPTFTYNVPYAVTYTGFCYAKDKIPSEAKVNSWAILNSKGLEGRISLLDDQREVIGAALMYLGYSINSKKPSEIDEAVELILKWKKNVGKFDAESYKSEIATGAIVLGQGYSTDVTQLIVGNKEKGIKPRPDIGFALPHEGFTIAFDEMVIPSTSKQKELAYKFMNFIYEPSIAKENMEYICGSNPVAPAIDALDADYRKLIVLDASTLKRGQLLMGFDNPEVMELYTKAWNRIKAGK